VVWIAWAVFTAATMKEIAASIRLHGPRPAPPRRGLARLGPAALVALVAVLFAAGPIAPIVSAARADATAPGQGSVAVSQVSQTPARSAANLGDHVPSAARPTYVVQRYDTVWRIAQHHLPGNPAQRYKDIVGLNPGTVGPDNEIVPGDELLLPDDAFGLPPAASTPEDLSVHPGDTLSGLAADHGISDWRTVWSLNRDHAEPGGQRFTDPNHIEPGWTFQLPVADAATAPPRVSAPPRTPPAHDAPPAPRMPPPARPTSTAPAPATPDTPASTTDSRPADPPASRLAAARSSTGLDVWNAVYFGAGALLAAGVFTTLQTLRRRQFRNRRPGRTISSAPAQLIPAEKALLTHGPTGLASVEFLDHALRSLSAISAQMGARLPDVVAARMVDDQLDLRLAAPHPTPPPAPWTADESGCWWSIRTGDELPISSANGATGSRLHQS
jgi:LysM repeat protein